MLSLDRVADELDLVEVMLDVQTDRKSTRLNSSHDQISYAVFCLKKKKKESHVGSYSENTQVKDSEHPRHRDESLPNHAVESALHAHTGAAERTRQRSGSDI